MLAGQVFDSRVKLKVAIQTIAGAYIDLLVSSSKIVIGEQQAGAKRRIEQECAAVTAANKISTQGKGQLSASVPEKEAGGMRRAVERPVSDQRRKRPNWNIRKLRIERGKELVTGE